MKSPVLLPVMTGLLALAGSGLAQAQEEQGRVISSTPIIQRVAVPRDVCTDEQVTYRGQKSGGGALLGAIAGGAMGNAIGDGSGRAAATAIGLIGGAILGNRVEGEPQPRTEIVRSCGTQTTYEPRTVAYDVATRTLAAQRMRGSTSASLTSCDAGAGVPAGHLECVLPYFRFMLAAAQGAARDL